MCARGGLEGSHVNVEKDYGKILVIYEVEVFGEKYEPL